MAGRIEACFDKLKKEKKKGLIPYLTAGDPSAEFTVPFLQALVEGGADILEIGIPFSDPVADGPVIEKAHHRAVRNGVTLKDVLSMVKTFRERDNETPIILMGYLNSIEALGYDLFARKAQNSGVDGVLIVDCPPEEADRLQSVLSRVGVDIIYLVSPNTDDKRIDKICKVSGGYIYYVSFKGVTGASGKLCVDNVRERIEHIKTFTSLPVCVGFGVRNGETAKLLGEVADAVIVGTALVNTVATHEGGVACKLIREQVREMRSAMDA